MFKFKLGFEVMEQRETPSISPIDPGTPPAPPAGEPAPQPAPQPAPAPKPEPLPPADW